MPNFYVPGPANAIPCAAIGSRFLPGVASKPRFGHWFWYILAANRLMQARLCARTRVFQIWVTASPRTEDVLNCKRGMIRDHERARGRVAKRDEGDSGSAG